MKKTLLIPVFIFLSGINFIVQAQSNGEEIFKSVCSACHTINKGRLVGPDLSGVYQLRDEQWLIRFIRSSQQLIKSGDSSAIAIYEEYNKIPMPDNKLSDEQILSLIKYIKDSDLTTSVVSAPAVSLTPIPSDSLELWYNIETASMGRFLFNGHVPFKNGASPCNSCHNINDQSIMGGGLLALDLTGSYLKLGPAGIKAIIINPPFPAMKTAMNNHELTEDEIQALLSMLKSVGEQKYAYQIPGAAGLFFFAIGFVFALVLIVHIYILYDNRKIT